MAEADPVAMANAPASKRARLFRVFGLILAGVALAVGAWWLLFAQGRVSTDNAYVGGTTALITPQVGGTVLQVPVAGTQLVQAGAVLVVLDDADARIALAQAEAGLGQARQRYVQASENSLAARARTAARAAEIAQARARLVEADAALTRARLELARRQRLAASGAVSAEELSTAEAGFASAEAARNAARTAVASAQAIERSAAGDFAAARALVADTSITTAPDVRAAQAMVDKARLDLARTTIRAPVAGIVTASTVQIGQRVNAGATLMQLVPVKGLWVDANFKEGQLAKVKPGQKVEMTSDLYGSSVVFHGTVAGFAGGTGAAFALIP
ncbi:MAG: HlyD family secretion protein, partial [Sphingomonadales bacterium]